MLASPKYRGARPAVALIEVLIAVAIIGVLLAIFSLAASDSRRNAQLSDSINNLKQFAWASSTYTADCNERFWSFSWKAFDNPTGQPFADDNAAAAAQAIDIITRRTNIQMSVPSSWIPHITFSHLVLFDQLNLKLPSPWSLSPGDRNREMWQQCADAPDPRQCFLDLPTTVRPSGSSNDILRYMCSTSYIYGPSFISHDMREGSNQTLQSGLSDHYSYIAGSLPLGDRLMTQVAHPSRKVMMWDSHQWYFGPRVAYFAYEEARVPLLMCDGSVGVRATSESNPGFYPNIPTQALPLRFNYAPRAWEPPTLSGAATQILTGHYQWTRGGLPGNDFSEAEICTGQPGCTP